MGIIELGAYLWSIGCSTETAKEQVDFMGLTYNPDVKAVIRNWDRMFARDVCEKPKKAWDPKTIY